MEDTTPTPESPAQSMLTAQRENYAPRSVPPQTAEGQTLSDDLASGIQLACSAVRDVGRGHSAYLADRIADSAGRLEKVRNIVSEEGGGVHTGDDGEALLDEYESLVKDSGYYPAVLAHAESRAALRYSSPLGEPVDMLDPLGTLKALSFKLGDLKNQYDKSQDSEVQTALYEKIADIENTINDVTEVLHAFSFTRDHYTEETTDRQFAFEVMLIVFGILVAIFTGYLMFSI